MEETYFDLIITGDRTINNVPKEYRDKVIALLEEKGRIDLLNSDK